MIQISKDQLTATIHEKGAELQSLQLNGLEYLWQGDPKYWGKRSPVLFPIVGELRDDKYIFDKKEYILPRHGFARDKVFEATQLSEAAAIFTLHSNAETMTVYPFEFIFQVQYEIRNNKLSCTYIVQNPDVKAMYFSVGGHPAFKVPLTGRYQYDDYALKFEKDSVLLRSRLKKGLVKKDTESIPLVKKKLPLDPSLFYDDAIVLKDLNSKKVKLFSGKDKHGLTLKFEGFPYFGIWASKNAPFICLEPWCGIADSVHHDYQLVNKEGIIQLPPYETWQRSWFVELF
jgi:galactose mutarotase-like enzyme